MSADTNPGAGATPEDQVQPYKFGDGIRALARIDPAVLLEMTLDESTKRPSGLVRRIVIGEIQHAQDERNKRIR